MSFDKIVVGDYGQVMKITFIDVDTDAAADISGYATTLQMVFTSPSGTVTAKTATFNTDGTDGIIKYTVESAFINAAGKWKVRGRVASGSAELTTEERFFNVLADTVPA